VEGRKSRGGGEAGDGVVAGVGHDWRKCFWCVWLPWMCGWLARVGGRKRIIVNSNMGQVQGLMEIFGREWCNLYCWTVTGSAVYQIRRDRAYWALCFHVLAEFWWAHVVPAKHALAANLPDEAEFFRFDFRSSRTLRSQCSKCTVFPLILASMHPLSSFPFLLC
jgi:hypothetical protein